MGLVVYLKYYLNLVLEEFDFMKSTLNYIKLNNAKPELKKNILETMM